MPTMTTVAPYKKPDGTLTKDIKAYADSYLKIGNRICKMLGPKWEVYAFDPDIAITENGTQRSSVIPLWLANAIYKELTKLDELEFRMKSLEK